MNVDHTEVDIDITIKVVVDKDGRVLYPAEPLNSVIPKTIELDKIAPRLSGALWKP